MDDYGRTRTYHSHACDVPGHDEVYVLGSQAILGQYPDALESLRQSADAHIVPVIEIDMVDVIDANLGELSRFHEAFGFYVHGVTILMLRSCRLGGKAGNRSPQ